MFGIANPIKPNCITKKEDSKVLDQNKHHISDPLPLLTLKKTQIKVNHFEEKHNAREIKAKHNAAIKASNTAFNVPTTDLKVRCISNVLQDLLLLYRFLYAIYGPCQNPEPNPVEA